jgi:hypothetical protein
VIFRSPATNWPTALDELDPTVPVSVKLVSLFA